MDGMSEMYTSERQERVILLAVFLLFSCLPSFLGAREVPPLERAIELCGKIREAMEGLPSERSSMDALRDGALARRGDMEIARKRAHYLEKLAEGPKALHRELQSSLYVLWHSTWIPEELEPGEGEKILRSYQEAKRNVCRQLNAFERTLRRRAPEAGEEGMRSFDCGFEAQRHAPVLSEGNVCLGASLLSSSFFTQGRYNPRGEKMDEQRLRRVLRYAVAGGSPLPTIDGYESLAHCSRENEDLFLEELKALNEEANAALNGFLNWRFHLGNRYEVARKDGWDHDGRNRLVYEDLISSLRQGEPVVLGIVADLDASGPLAKMEELLAGESRGAQEDEYRFLHAVLLHGLTEYGDKAFLSFWDPSSCVIDDFEPMLAFDKKEGIFYYVRSPRRLAEDLPPLLEDGIAAKVFLAGDGAWRNPPREAFECFQTEGSEAPETPESPEENLSSPAWDGLVSAN